MSVPAMCRLARSRGRWWLSDRLARVVALALLMAGAAAAGPVRPLAQDHVVVAASPDPQNIILYNPTILALPTGRLVAGYVHSDKVDASQSTSLVLTSDDGGLSWTERARAPVGQARLFAAGGALYYLGSGSRMRIMRSDDDGTTWSEPVVLDSRAWHQTASNVWHARGRVWLALERRVERKIDAWSVGELAPVLLSGDANADLRVAANWRFSDELMFADIIPGYRENAPATGPFGVPFFAQSYPGRTDIGGKRSFSPLGWLETNVVQVLDPDHFWHDPTGRTFHLLLRANTGMTGYAALAVVTEQPDGSLQTSLQRTPAGGTQLFLPMPGGQMRFHLLYDTATQLYWLLGSQATDSMTRAELLPPERFGTPDNERHRLVLHFSRNLVDWCFAGLVAAGGSPKEARHYASMDIAGDDLVILSRSGDAAAKSAHDGNLITFHRVKNFRALVY